MVASRASSFRQAVFKCNHSYNMIFFVARRDFLNSGLAVLYSSGGTTYNNGYIHRLSIVQHIAIVKP